MCIIGRHSIYSVAFRPPHAHGHSVVQSSKGRHDGAGPWSGCRRPPPFRATGVAPPGRGWRRPPALTSVTAIAPGPPETSTCVGGGGLDGMFARLFSRQVECGTILTASKSQGIHACFCELLFVSGCGWHHVDHLDTSGNRDGVFLQVCLRPGAFRAICTVSKFQGIETVFLQVFTVSKSKSRRYFCKCVFASGRVSPPFVPSRNLKESRLSFCKVLPPQNYNGDDICCKLLVA